MQRHDLDVEDIDPTTSVGQGALCATNIRSRLVNKKTQSQEREPAALADSLPRLTRDESEPGYGVTEIIDGRYGVYG